jgi:hypothetical protein
MKNVTRQSISAPLNGIYVTISGTAGGRVWGHEGVFEIQEVTTGGMTMSWLRQVTYCPDRVDPGGGAGLVEACVGFGRPLLSISGVARLLRHILNAFG